MPSRFDLGNSGCDLPITYALIDDRGNIELKNYE
jgi:hypothetical protein